MFAFWGILLVDHLEQWFTKCGPKTAGVSWDPLQDVCEADIIFIILLRSSLHFHLLKFVETLVESVGPMSQKQSGKTVGALVQVKAMALHCARSQCGSTRLWQ